MPISSGERRASHRRTPRRHRGGHGVSRSGRRCALGRAGVADLVERTCWHAARFTDGLRAAGYRILNDLVINQVLVSFGSDDLTRRVIAHLQADGTCWCDSTVWQGQTAMRISVSSCATTEADVERSLAAMLRIAAEQCQR